jgi:uncharacterized protein YlzI (FlbEa/FlbD family)
MIKLHRLIEMDGEKFKQPVYLNSSYMCSISESESEGSGSLIKLSTGNRWWVVESPEEVMNLIRGWW